MTKQYPTKQYLSEVVSNREFAEGVPPEIVIVMARQLLASMEQEPALVVGDDGGDALAYRRLIQDFPAGTKLYAAPQLPQPAVPETLPCPVMLEPGLRFGKGVRTQTMLDALQRRAEYYAGLEAMTPEERADHDAGMKEFAAMLQGAEPVSQSYTLREGLTAIRNSGIAIDAGKIQAERDALNALDVPVGWVLVPIDMAPEQMRAVQLNSELGAYAAANLTGAYSLFREFWDVAVESAHNQEAK